MLSALNWDLIKDRCWEINKIYETKLTNVRAHALPLQPTKCKCILSKYF